MVWQDKMTETKTKTLHSWIALEHARLHLITAWPESARKQALLIAIRSSIQRLMVEPEAASFKCLVCRTGRKMMVLPSPRRTPVSGFHEIAA
ncbi:MAG: hypothetical protein JWO19_1230 [Bryobacterales bacterium]|nr:hypothetical protein [Bryobacterales bacterium]